VNDRPAVAGDAAPDGLRAYVEAIEDQLRRRRGADHALVPRDFVLAKGWYRAGLPLAAVLLGIDRAFEADPSISSLSSCRRRVEELMASGPRPEPLPVSERVPAAELLELLGLLEERLRALPPVILAAFELPLRRLGEVRDLVAVGSRPNWDYVMGKLREIDDGVSAAVVGALPAEEAARIRVEAARASDRHRGRVDAGALEEAAGRLTVQRAREALGLPRLRGGLG
jgi:hypothetical protein